jgi:transcriptional regulator with GAF, ATPase, and Fis domain
VSCHKGETAPDAMGAPALILRPPWRRRDAGAPGGDIGAGQRHCVLALGDLHLNHHWVTIADLGLEGVEPSWQDPSALKEARLDLERPMVREALQQAGHNVQAAERRLGVSRMTHVPPARAV